jgi:predicted nucleic acid-binding protein
VPEVCNAARRKVRLGESHPAQAQQIAQRLRGGVLALRPTAPLASRALELAFALDFYLALAEAEQVGLVTADRRLAGRLRGTSWGASVRTL